MTLERDSLHRFLRSRRSVRHFEDSPVGDAQIRRMLETGIRAASAHNRQPWRFAVIRDRETKSHLAAAMGEAFRKDLLADGCTGPQAELQVSRSRSRILEAPLVVILFLTMLEMDRYADSRRQGLEHHMAAQSVALAGGNILLAAHAEGLAGVWVCAPLFAQSLVSETLGLPADWEAQGMLLIGRPTQVPEARTRKPVDEITRFL